MNSSTGRSLDALVGAEGGLKGTAEATGNLDAVERPTVVRGREQDADGGGAPVEPGQRAPAQADELLGERLDRLGRGIEGSAGQDRQGDPRADGSPGHDEARGEGRDGEEQQAGGDDRGRARQRAQMRDRLCPNEGQAADEGADDSGDGQAQHDDREPYLELSLLVPRQPHPVAPNRKSGVGSVESRTSRAPRSISKWRCGPVLKPVEPSSPTTSPA